MADEAPKSGGGMQRLVLWLVIAALLAAVWWLASERNERHFRVTADNAQVLIERGRFFPMGTAASGDKMYAPIPIPAGEKAPGEMEFDDQNSIDRYLFGVLGDWARNAAKKGDTHTAAALAGRAGELPGLTGGQVAELTALKADLAWDDALTAEQQAAQLLDGAIRNLNVVAAGKGLHALDAALEGDRVRALVQAVRAGPPPASKPAPAPTPAPAVAPAPAGK